MNDFLNFVRPRQPICVPCNLNALCVETLTALQYHESAKGKTLQQAFDLALPPQMVDIDQIRQVLWNLILNGLQAMPEGGILTVSSALQDKEAVVAIRDSGSGIAKHKIQKIFEPFYTTKKGGSGLGLAISRRIVEAHGGRIEVESEERRGTTIRIIFPLQK